MTEKRIAILGSTGSIGRQALEIIAAEPRFRACALSAGGNGQLLAEQARRTGAECVALADPAAADELAGQLGGDRELLTGPDALSELIRRTRPDVVVTAVVGSAGLAPTLAAIECGADLAIANKETLVMAGAAVMPAARAAGVRILPVDSEHSAIFQCLAAGRAEQVRRIVLTASGGPFRTASAEQVRQASLAEVLNHPTWNMGAKVTIDSATLMNKALEVIEAHWLFDLPGERIDVLIHPESIVHGMVEYTDGSVLAQLGRPAMTTPIAVALYAPDRAAQPPAPLDLAAMRSLTFEPVDRRRFPALDAGYEVIRRGGTAGAVLNGANEAAVQAFIAGRIAFGQIVEIVREVLNQAPLRSEVTLEGLQAADADSRQRAEAAIAARCTPAGHPDLNG
jgi:1-deoxy-D-xylulose-5-phosphate reductoisomerase